MNDYRLVADAVAADIAAGRLRPGEQLPPQRIFARKAGIANSTASRVYQELNRRGLTVGEVGRGTFVRAADAPVAPVLSDPKDNSVDLELNYPVVPEQSALLAKDITALLRPDALGAAVRPVGAVGTPAARIAAAALASRGGWQPDPEQIVFAGNGRQMIAAALAALVPRGARLGVEEFSYPLVKAIADQLGIILVPLPVDEDGLLPDAVAAAHRSAPLRAVYLQPTLHNPLSFITSEPRRVALADVFADCGVYAVEDAVWAFLREDLPPFAALAPDTTVLVDSLSKRLVPGMTLGFAVAPRPLLTGIAVALRSGGWTPMRFALEAATAWTASGTVATIAQAKREDAMLRQATAQRELANFAVRGNPASYYCWWELPRPWRADTFVTAAARQGIAVTPAAAFTVGTTRAPNAVRLALASPRLDALSRALRTLADIARATPDTLVAE
jgi:DNA-binding transcriptional MocR family regulator